MPAAAAVIAIAAVVRVFMPRARRCRGGRSRGDVALGALNDPVLFAPVMLEVAFACPPVLLTGRTIARWEGAVFVFHHIEYVVYLILAAQQHDGLDEFSGVMLGFVVPITVVTLVVSVSRPATQRG